MILLHSIQDCEQLPTNNAKYLVPTMGALHAGHCSLIEKAKQLAQGGGCVIVSIFVNPTQFNRKEDLDAYPSTLENDLKLCKASGADFVFIPSADTMYYKDQSISLVENSLTRGLCGSTRPGHFDGVCLVVTKLFNICRATHAIFGEKDFQQIAIIRRMVRDLNIPVQVIGGATVREASGLAMSSRNLNLTEENKKHAPSVFTSLNLAKKAYLSGEKCTKQLIKAAKSALLSLPVEIQIDYLEIVDAESLHPLESIDNTSAIIAIAVFFGEVRLIDHLKIC